MKFMHMFLAAALAVSSATLGVVPSASAGSLDIGPVSFQLYGPERTATLTVRNTEAEAVQVQVRAFDWTQTGDNSLTASDILQVSPPFFELGPDQEQVVRLVITDAVDTSKEVAFRLFIDEVPDASTGETGVVVPLRIVLPVFLTPSIDARPSLAWSVALDGDRLEVSATNTGDSRERIVDLALVDETANNSTLIEGLAGYVLAGSTRTWTLDTTVLHSSDSILISGNGYGGAFHSTVTAQQ